MYCNQTYLQCWRLKGLSTQSLTLTKNAIMQQRLFYFESILLVSIVYMLFSNSTFVRHRKCMGAKSAHVKGRDGTESRALPLAGHVWGRWRAAALSHIYFHGKIFSFFTVFVQTTTTRYHTTHAVSGSTQGNFGWLCTTLCSVGLAFRPLKALLLLRSPIFNSMKW